MADNFVWNGNPGGERGQFRRLKPGFGILFNKDGHDLHVATSGIVAFAINLGSGNGVFLGKDGERLLFATLAGGAENEISGASGTLLIDSSKIKSISSFSGILSPNLLTGNKFKVNLTESINVVLDNPRSGAKYFFILKQGLGGDDATWPANVLWVGGLAPTLTAASGAVDIVSMMYDNTDDVFYASPAQDFS